MAQRDAVDEVQPMSTGDPTPISPSTAPELRCYTANPALLQKLSRDANALADAHRKAKSWREKYHEECNIATIHQATIQNLEIENKRLKDMFNGLKDLVAKLCADDGPKKQTVAAYFEAYGENWETRVDANLHWSRTTHKILEQVASLRSELQLEREKCAKAQTVLDQVKALGALVEENEEDELVYEEENTDIPNENQDQGAIDDINQLLLNLSVAEPTVDTPAMPCASAMPTDVESPESTC